jgi:hypothetical protein
MRLRFLLVVVAMCLASCSTPAEKPTPTPPLPEYNSVATIKDIMDSMVDPSADYVWRSVGAEITAAGTVERAPKTDEDWDAERHHVIQLVEAANLLIMPGRQAAAPGHKTDNPEIELSPEETTALIRETPKTWFRLAREFQTTSIELLKATEKRDLEGIDRLGAELDTRCENCHKTYWYSKDPVFKNEPKEIDKDKN